MVSSLAAVPEKSYAFCAERTQQCDMLSAEWGDVSIHTWGRYEGRRAFQLALSSGIL